MLFYSKPSQYALRAVSYIVRNEKKGACQAVNIAKNENIPKPFLSKILKRLVESKILVSSKGPGGGFTLAQDPRHITVMDVIRVFDDIDEELKICAIGWAKCSDDKPCALHSKFKKLREDIQYFLEAMDLDIFADIQDFKKTDLKRKK